MDKVQRTYYGWLALWIIILLIVLIAMSSPSHAQVRLELTCPSGTTNMNQVSPTYDLQTQAYRQWACVDSSGNVTLQGITGGGGVTSISAGSGITLTPNPIIATGTIALTNPVSTNGLSIVGIGGTTTLTGPAGAGLGLTSSSGIITTNGPGCTTTTLNYGGSTGQVGISLGNPFIGFCTGSATDVARFDTRSGLSGLYLPSGGFINFNSGGINTAADTTVTRAAGAWVQIGAGTTSNNLGGIISSANTCILATSVTGAGVQTACTFSLPAVARLWSISCPNLTFSQSVAGSISLQLTSANGQTAAQQGVMQAWNYLVNPAAPLNGAPLSIGTASGAQTLATIAGATISGNLVTNFGWNSTSVAGTLSIQINFGAQTGTINSGDTCSIN